MSESLAKSKKGKGAPFARASLGLTPPSLTPNGHRRNRHTHSSCQVHGSGSGIKKREKTHQQILKKKHKADMREIACEKSLQVSPSPSPAVSRLDLSSVSPSPAALRLPSDDGIPADFEAPIAGGPISSRTVSSHDESPSSVNGEQRVTVLALAGDSPSPEHIPALVWPPAELVDAPATPLRFAHGDHGHYCPQMKFDHYTRAISLGGKVTAAGEYVQKAGAQLRERGELYDCASSVYVDINGEIEQGYEEELAANLPKVGYPG